MMYAMDAVQYNTVYNVLSFALASMMGTTLFLWMRVPAIADKMQSAVIVSGLVTFIAAYHYYRIFNSWVAAYDFAPGTSPQLTGVPFNDAYRYMDWVLTVPLLLIELLMVMNLPQRIFNMKARKLGVSSVLMIVSGYYGEHILEGNFTPRWVCFGISMFFFVYIIGVLDGLFHTAEDDTNPLVKRKIQTAFVITGVSWFTYPVVYVFPMVGFTEARAVVAIQVGYCCSDIISKCGVGLLIYQISHAKSAEKALPK